MTTDIVVFSQEFCPNCEAMKEYLDQKGILYETRDLQDPEVYANILLDGCTTIQEAPIIRINGSYYTMDSALGILN